jgi:hypothetical protein
MNIKPEISQIIAVYLALFLFGILYDSVICFALLRKWLEGFTWVAAISRRGITAKRGINERQTAADWQRYGGVSGSGEG